MPRQCSAYEYPLISIEWSLLRHLRNNQAYSDKDSSNKDEWTDLYHGRILLQVELSALLRVFNREKEVGIHDYILYFYSY